MTIETDNERIVQVIQPSGGVFEDWSQELYARGLDTFFNRFLYVKGLVIFFTVFYNEILNI